MKSFDGELAELGALAQEWNKRGFSLRCIPFLGMLVRSPTDWVAWNHGNLLSVSSGARSLIGSCGQGLLLKALNASSQWWG